MSAPAPDKQILRELGSQIAAIAALPIQQQRREMHATLYKWRHLPGDMVVDGFVISPYVGHDTGVGISEDVDLVRTDDRNDVVSRHFHIQIASEADLEKIKFPQVTFDPEATERSFETLADIFAGIMPVEKRGIGGFWFAPWDELIRWTGVARPSHAPEPRKGRQAVRPCVSPLAGLLGAAVPGSTGLRPWQGVEAPLRGADDEGRHPRVSGKTS